MKHNSRSCMGIGLQPLDLQLLEFYGFSGPSGSMDPFLFQTLRLSAQACRVQNRTQMRVMNQKRIAREHQAGDLRGEVDRSPALGRGPDYCKEV